MSKNIIVSATDGQSAVAASPAELHMAQHYRRIKALADELMVDADHKPAARCLTSTRTNYRVAEPLI